MCLWDPAVLLDKDSKAHGKTPLLAKMAKHTGAVRGVGGGRVGWAEM